MACDADRDRSDQVLARLMRRARRCVLGAHAPVTNHMGPAPIQVLGETQPVARYDFRLADAILPTRSAADKFNL